MGTALMITLAISFLPLIAEAQEIYKWKDENGQWHFTNSPPARPKSSPSVAPQRSKTSPPSVLHAATADPKIEAYCKRIVGQSYQLMETCIKGETEAKIKLDGRSPDPKIHSYCQRIVDHSYQLMETCIKGEEDAKRRLGY